MDGPVFRGWSCFSTQSTTDIPADGNWHLLSLTYTRTATAGNVQFFVDGVPRNTVGNTDVTSHQAPPSPDTTATLIIGASVNSEIQQFLGDMDEVEMFNRAVTPAEWTGLFNARAIGKCRDLIPIIVTTSPPFIGATVALSPGGSQTDSYSTAATPGTYTASAQPTVTTSTTEYRLRTPNTWTPTSAAGPSTTASVIAATIFTAFYDTYYRVTLSGQGCAAQGIPGVGPGSGNGWLLAGSTVSATLSGITGYTVTGGTINGVPQIPTSGVLSITVNPVNGPLTIIVNCAPGQGVPITVQTNQSGALAFTIAGNASVNGTYTAPKTYTATAGDSGYSHTTISPQTVAGTYYTFQNWSPSPTSTPAALPQSIPGIPTTATTYTANFNIAGYVVTVVNNCGGVSVGPVAQAISTTPLIFPPNTPLAVSAAPGSNQTLTNVVVSQPGAANQTFTFANGATTVSIGNLTGPITITVNCGTATGVTHTVTTSPAALKVTIDGSAQLTAPQTTSAWVAGTNHALGAPTQLNTAGTTQYTLKSTNGWTTTAGAISPTGAIASAPATSSTYTASFDTAYKVTMQLSGCTLLRDNTGIPASGGSAFIAAGTSIQFGIIPISGQQPWNVTLNGVNQNITGGFATTQTVNGPITVIAECGRITAAYSPNSLGVADLKLTSAAGSATAINLRVTSIGAFNPATITYTNTGLISVWGNLAAGQSAARNVILSATSGSLAIPFTYTVTYQADNMPAQTAVISVPFPRP